MTYEIIGKVETSRKHYKIQIRCEFGAVFYRRPLRLHSKGFTICPGCKDKLWARSKAA